MEHGPDQSILFQDEVPAAGIAACHRIENGKRGAALIKTAGKVSEAKNLKDRLPLRSLVRCREVGLTSVPKVDIQEYSLWEDIINKSRRPLLDAQCLVVATKKGLLRGVAVEVSVLDSSVEALPAHQLSLGSCALRKTENLSQEKLWTWKNCGTKWRRMNDVE
eukprot:s2858_g5.t2